MRRFLLLLSFFLMTPTVLFLSGFLLLSSASQQGAGNGLSIFAPQEKTIAYAALPTNLNVVGDSIQKEDVRIGRVASFLEAYNSPLTDYAGFIVNTADKYNVDYRLIPAIAMQESILCKKEITGTHNCWGFGIYGKKVTSFDNYSDAIDTITRYFAKKKNSGIDTLDELGSIYNPTDHNNWKANVASFMTQL